jgi:hypothetical protein
MARYHGRKGTIYMSTTGTGNASPLGSMSSWDLNMATDTVEVTSFGDANKTYVQGLPDLSGSMSGFFEDTQDVIFDAAASADGCKIYLYPSSDAPTIYWYDPAWVDASISTGVSAAITVSANFRANGSWAKKPA